jgi:DNA-binding LacI/PurR family transcriptional regulator
MPNLPPTIYDVAREAGVSIATVSRVLNFPLRVNSKTRTTVMNAIDLLGYVPKAESRARALKETRRIGVLIPFFTAPSFVQRLRGISTVLNQHDYEMVIYPVDSKLREKSYLDTLPMHKALDGLIIVSQVFDSTIAQRLLENKLETVVIEFNDPNFTTLEINDEDGGSLATRFLIEKGYMRVAFIGGQQQPLFGVNPIIKRMAGYNKVINEAKIILPKEYCQEYAMNPAMLLEDLIQLGLPLAIFAATDLQAIALIKEARKLGLRVPMDVAIIGFDDIDMAEYFGLTTVHQPLDESGRIGAELLISRLTDPSQTIQHIQLPLSIVERETV